MWYLVKWVQLALDHIFDMAEDFRLPHVVPALLVAVETLIPEAWEAWEAYLHNSTSPVPRTTGLQDGILDHGLGPIGFLELPRDLWDSVIPPFYEDGLPNFDVESPWEDEERLMKGARN